MVLRNAAVHTMATPERVDAIAIRGGRIVYAGDNSGADRLIGDVTEVDLGGRMVLPGFHDTHVHPQGGISLSECRLDDLATRQAIVDSVAACARAAPNAPWVRGRGWALPVFPGANPRKEWLDQVVPDRPVFLTAADGHSAWVNSRALEMAGVTRATPDPPNGRIERDSRTGDPSGTLRESAEQLAGKHLPGYSLAERMAGLERAMTMANQLGITTLHDASAGPDALEAYAELDRAGRLTARVIAAQYVDPLGGLGQVDSLVARRERFRGPRYFRPTAVKFFADGVIEAKTAALLAPYLHSGDTTGIANFSERLLDSLVAALDRVGFQIHVHAIGDRAIRISLDALERARRVNGPRDARPILAHIQLFDPADIPRFKALGVIASFQPLWAQADKYITELTEPVLGPERSRWLYPIGSMAKSGATVAAGSDWTVSSMNPLEAIQVALTRRSPTDSAAASWIPAEVVDVGTMLRAYTVNGAFAAFDETTNGALEIGKAADVIVLDRDLTRIPPTEIHRAKVLLSLLDGRVVYRDRVLR